LSSTTTAAAQPLLQEREHPSTRVQVSAAVQAPHYFLFDYLRFLLAAGVLAGHANAGGVLPGYLADLCVKVFFALSGFLIGGILLRTRPQDLPRFYFNRVTRIWIPYAIAIGLLLLGTIAYGQPLIARTLEFFFYKVTFVYNVFGPPQLARFANLMPLKGTGNHFWSICVEEQFYLVAPLVIIFFRRLRVPLLIAVWLIGTVFQNTSVNFSPIALGVLLAISKARFGSWYLRMPGMLACLALWGASAVAIIMRLPGYDPTAALFAASSVALLARTGVQLPFGEFAGGLSYPLYLNHWIGLLLIKPIERWFAFGTGAATMTGSAIAIGLALAHFAVVDRRILHNRTCWYTPRRGVICCAFAYALLVMGLLVGFWIAGPAK